MVPGEESLRPFLEVRDPERQEGQGQTQGHVAER